MIIGIPKEIKDFEYRVGATPAKVKALVDHGHEVMVETGAGEKVGYPDEEYLAVGAEIASSKEEVYRCEMIIKVKELQEQEFPLLREGQIIFGYMHLAPDPVQTRHLVEKKVVAIAFETVTDAQGRLPLLVPMSEIAGRLSIQAGAVALQMNNGGSGLLLGGVPGVSPANVTVIGGGIVGTEAARMAMGLGAHVSIMDTNLDRLRQLDSRYGPQLKTLYSTQVELENILPRSDLVIGSVLIPGKLAPKLLTRKLLRKMIPGSVLVDVAIDQGGCAETSRPTTHGDPTYVEEGVVHYCVANIPGACARTATRALTNATLRYSLTIANKGWRQALKDDPCLLNGLNVCMGNVTNKAVAEDLNYTFHPPEQCV